MFCRRLCLGLMLLIVPGCGGASEKDYHPSVNSAREALTVALTAWKDGTAQGGRVEDCTPPLQMNDAAWSAGGKLTDFEILKEEQLPDGPHKLTAKITLAGQPEPLTIGYVVMGKDPLWIVREEDYQTGLGM